MFDRRDDEDWTVLVSPASCLGATAALVLLLALLLDVSGLGTGRVQAAVALVGGVLLGLCTRPPEAYSLQGAVLVARVGLRTRRVQLDALALAHVGLAGRGPQYLVLRDVTGSSLDLVADDSTHDLRSAVGRRVDGAVHAPDVRRLLLLPPG